MSELVFDGQREGEEVRFMFRRHFIATRKGVVFLVIMGLLGLAPMLIWRDNPAMFWIFLIFLTVGLIGFFYAYILWYFTVFIVTDERIRQISQKGIFRKSVVDLGLNKIQSISYSIPGIAGGVLGFGTIMIQTGVGDLIISEVKSPAKVYEKLQKTVKEAENV